MASLSGFVQGSSASSSNRHRTPRYDVFLSFRGYDTRLSFTDHLRNALVNADLETFLDDEEIESGQDLKPELKNAIESSRASIIILSKNYASSTWCLDELVLILEQQRGNSDHIVIPIFYHVEPTDVRKQQSSFGDAMEDHKQKMEKETDAEKRSKLAQKMELWKKALTQIADMKGKDVNGRKETEFIKEIVDDIYRRLGVPLRSTLPLLIGMDYSVKRITSWLKDGSLHSVDIFTILGMGGIGKTSLAKYVYGLHCREFHSSSFIEDISRRCASKVNGLHDLQKQICGDILKASSIQVRDVSVYTSKIENALARKKVFLVLDDIDSLHHLDALLGNKGFYPGSKIIITTKDASLTERCALIKREFQSKHTKHLLKGLCGDASLQVLSHHAFTCKNPKDGYDKVSEKIVKYCEGHPLALEVLGKSLHNRDVTYWEECIEGLKNETDSRIRKALQISFDSLSFKNDKELFKHIACFFVGMDREYIETILNACDINTRSGITNLIDRCLLSIGCNNTLMMHQLIQDMGRDVVRQESPQKPWKQSRLWCHEDSFKVLKRKKGSENLLGLALDMRMFEKEKLRGSFEIKANALSKMDNLMLLQLNYVQINGSCRNFPEELRWLCMHGCLFKSIPLDLPMENLVVLDMAFSSIESFDMSIYSNPLQPRKLIGPCPNGKRLLGSLKILDLSFCEQLHRLGGFMELPALERLIVRKCIGLIEVCESIEQCDKLVIIDMSYCIKLQKLPRTLGKLKKVKTLSLDGCNLGEVPIKMRNMDSLETPEAKSIGTKSQTSSTAIVEAIPSDLNYFAVSLPISLVRLSLVNSNLSNNSFPMDFSCLSMLKELHLDENPIVSMPKCVSSLPNLEILSMDDCEMLTSIEHPPRTLRELRICYYRLKCSNTILLQKVVFDRDMSPLKLILDLEMLPWSSFEIEGMIKIQPMADVEEKVLRIFGWSNLEFLKQKRVGAYNSFRGAQSSEIQMYYECGIFSTIYDGEEMPKWISERRNGPSISFTIPSSSKNLKRFNFCFVKTFRVPFHEYPNAHSFNLPLIRIRNITKNRTWIYKHYISCAFHVDGKSIIMLSHWMFGMNDMEAGDHVIINVSVLKGLDYEHELIRECGVGFVHDDVKMKEEEEEEEEVLGYYKSWNHIIGGDLDAFQTKTTGEYLLFNRDFFRKVEDKEVLFRAFSQRKTALLGHTPTPTSEVYFSTPKISPPSYGYVVIKRRRVRWCCFKTFMWHMLCGRKPCYCNWSLDGTRCVVVLLHVEC